MNITSGRLLNYTHASKKFKTMLYNLLNEL